MTEGKQEASPLQRVTKAYSTPFTFPLFPFSRWLDNLCISQWSLLKVSLLLQTPGVLQQCNYWDPVLLSLSSPNQNTGLPLWLTNCCTQQKGTMWSIYPQFFQPSVKNDLVFKVLQALDQITQILHTVPLSSSQQKPSKKQMVIMTINYYDLSYSFV